MDNPLKRVSLDEIEADAQRAIRREARNTPPSTPLLAFIVGGLCIPSLVVVFLFVPFLGQFLVLGASALTLYYIWLTRPWRELLSGVVAVILVGVMAATVQIEGTLFSGTGAYLLMGFCMALAIAYCVCIAAAIRRAYHAAYERLHTAGGSL